MKAVLLKNFGAPENMYIGDFPDPIINEDEVLIQVFATALNRADLLQRKGKYPPPAGESKILGLEVAGEIKAVGKHVKNWKIGQRVCGLLPGGGYATLAKIDQNLLLPIPDGMTFEQAAAIPEVFLTAFQALVWLAEINEKKNVLIHAGASGVGTAAIQLVKLFGKESYVTASAPKHGLCLSLGAQKAIDYRHEDFEQKILEYTENGGVDIIIDFIGANYFESNINLLKRDGHLIMLAYMGGAMASNLNLSKVLINRLKIIGSTLRSRTLDYKIKLTRAFSDKCWEYFSTGQLLPVLDTIFDWEDVIEAHQKMENNQNKGKIVLKVS